MNDTTNVPFASGAAVDFSYKLPSVIDLQLANQMFNSDKEQMRIILGGKAAGLAEMISSGVRVPPAFTITTDVCAHYYQDKQRLPKSLMPEVLMMIKVIEARTGKGFGDTSKPLLVSVRSGSRFSMPGMMDTILNLGLNDETAETLIAQTGNPAFVWDSYQRLIQMYGTVVLNIPKAKFEHALLEDLHKDSAEAAAQYQQICSDFKQVILEETGRHFPSSPSEQLREAITAVFASWNNPRAVLYRKLHGIGDHLGTAVTVQAMVFGNLDSKSGTGVAFSRNPSTGIKELFGEFLAQAQGEDVVSGSRTPAPLSQLQHDMPKIYKELDRAATLLEHHFNDMQDIEFTIERGTLYLLQTRTGKRTAGAATKIAVDMVHEGLISKQQALQRIEPNSLSQLLLPSFASDDIETARRAGRLICKGLKASPGAASGQVVFDPHQAQELASNGISVILLRTETCPDDLHGMVAAKGIITARGGLTSHAAVVARGMGKACIAGCDHLKIDYNRQEARVDRTIIRRGDILSMDGSTGEVFLGPIKPSQPHYSSHLNELLEWADLHSLVKVRANADTPEDALRARTYGARGIGLCRTEHMFMGPERLSLMQQMILARSQTQRRAALEQIRVYQEEDFKGIFKAMADLPVTIRLLDPPLHEFLPKEDEIRKKLTEAQAVGDVATYHSTNELLQRIHELKENNPMLGFRGCRLGLIYPEIYRMQMKAIIRAAIAVQKDGIITKPEIMMPLISHHKELELLKRELSGVADAVMQECGHQIDYLFGTMLEVPRACLTAEELATSSDFFSFGTNDLTQLTYGLSRDDAEGTFLQNYLRGVEIQGKSEEVLTENPFSTLDKAVTNLIRVGVHRGRSVKESIKIGICGEHGGDPQSIGIAHDLAFDYVSCSPFRIPTARLAAAQSALTQSVKTQSVKTQPALPNSAPTDRAQKI
jgi:pyruvate,orthophosphate dikinase